MKSKKFTPTPSRILGIDPGYGRIGLAVVESLGTSQKIIHSECFETESKLPHSTRLFLVGTRLDEIINEYKPNQIATESLLWSKNKKTALQVAEARGIIIFEAVKNNLKIREFNPNQIKLAITGYGKSDKKQVISMIEKLVKLPTKKRHDDEYDAIAIALTSAAIPLSTEIYF
jgi:crossover junction endodeoxyribonuclease RuvC